MKFFLSLFLLFLGLSVLPFSSVYAATIRFNATTFTIAQGEKKQVTVVLDTEGKKAFGAVATIKITSGTDVIRINSVVPTVEIDTNEMRVTDSTSSGDNRVSFTVIREVGAYFEGVSNLAILEIEGLKNGTAKIEVVTADPEPSTVADFDTNDELLSTLGSATFNLGGTVTTPTPTSTPTSNNNNDEDDDGDNNGGGSSSSNNNSSGSSSGSSTPTTAAVPATGTSIYFYILLLGLTLVGTSFVIRGVVVKS